MEPSENADLRAAPIGQAKSTGYFIKLRDCPEFDLIRPAGANRLIVAFKAVRIIGIMRFKKQQFKYQIECQIFCVKIDRYRQVFLVTQ